VPLPLIAANVRPNDPGWVRSAPGFNVVWHHVIPYALLRDVWNALVNQAAAKELGEARVALRQYLRLCGQPLPDIDQLIDRMPDMEIPECNAQATQAVWPAWNIVEGPATNLRSDDPGERGMDRYFQGITPLEFARMRALDPLYLDFQIFNQATQNLDANTLRGISAAIRVARMSLQADLPIPYRPAMWVRQSDGRFRKARHGEIHTAAAH
jgi:hypothetical protein